MFWYEVGGQKSALFHYWHNYSSPTESSQLTRTCKTLCWVLKDCVWPCLSGSRSIQFLWSDTVRIQLRTNWIIHKLSSVMVICYLNPANWNRIDPKSSLCQPWGTFFTALATSYPCFVFHFVLYTCFDHERRSVLLSFHWKPLFLQILTDGHNSSSPLRRSMFWSACSSVSHQPLTWCISSEQAITSNLSLFLSPPPPHILRSYSPSSLASYPRFPLTLSLSLQLLASPGHLLHLEFHRTSNLDNYGKRVPPLPPPHPPTHSPHTLLLINPT